VFKAFADGHVKPHAKTLQVKIPKGVTNGSVIRLAGQGGKGIGGGIDGDLLLTVGVENERGALQDSLDDAISTFDGKHRADLFSRKVVKLRDRKL
jgi:DnaJ-class molecular chaperone